MKVGVFSINDSFSKSIIERLKERHNVNVCRLDESNENFNMANICSILKWCDVAFFDFIHYPLNRATQLQGIECKIVARLHGIEVYNEMREIDWDRVDKLICTEPQRMRVIRENVSLDKIEHKIEILPIGTDLGLFKFDKDRTYGSTEPTFRYDMCMVNFFLPRKRVYTTIETVMPLLRRMWTLHIRGSVTPQWRQRFSRECGMIINELIAQYNEKYINEDRIRIYDKYMHKNLYSKWLSNKDIIINNSTQEGYGKSIIDAMACGVYPVIKNWLGADKIFPEKYLFETQKELIDNIEWWQDSTADTKRELGLEARVFAEKHNEKKVAWEVRKIIEKV